MIKNKKMKQMKHWPSEDRPREKLRNKGAAHLTETELLTILIQNGTKEKSAMDLAQELVDRSGNRLADLARMSTRELMKTKGIGMAKAVAIQAAMELGRRRMGAENLKSTVVTGSASVAKYLQAKLMDLPHEVFAVLFLNRANRIRHFEIISSGGMTGTVADPRIILKKALEEDAVSIILCHNHPSGNLRPSRADEELTSKIRHAAKYFDIQVLDHIIVSTDGYYSFADEGAL
jgi:DNA repair protein RadC